MPEENFVGRLCTDLLIEVESRILFCLHKHDPVKHKEIYSALAVSLDQVQRAQSLRNKWKDPQLSTIQQLKNMPIIDGKSRGAGEKDDNS
jgi:hypothetical protein